MSAWCALLHLFSDFPSAYACRDPCFAHARFPHANCGIAFLFTTCNIFGVNAYSCTEKGLVK